MERRSARPEERVKLFVLLFTGFVLATVSFLWHVGETRLDAYYCLFTLEYLVLLYTVVPGAVRSRLRVRILTIIMVLIAFVLIGWRIYQVLQR